MWNLNCGGVRRGWSAPAYQSNYCTVTVSPIGSHCPPDRNGKWQMHLVITFNSARPSELCAPMRTERKIHLQHCDTVTCMVPKQPGLYNSQENIMCPSAYSSSKTNTSDILMVQACIQQHQSGPAAEISSAIKNTWLHLNPKLVEDEVLLVHTKKVLQLVNSACSCLRELWHIKCHGSLNKEIDHPKVSSDLSHDPLILK